MRFKHGKSLGKIIIKKESSDCNIFLISVLNPRGEVLAEKKVASKNGNFVIPYFKENDGTLRFVEEAKDTLPLEDLQNFKFVGYCEYVIEWDSSQGGVINLVNGSKIIDQLDFPEPEQLLISRSLFNSVVADFI